MRVQEHLYQGFFGDKKKKDALKFYRERTDKLRIANSKLDECIAEFQRIVDDHRNNLRRFNDFVRTPNHLTLKALKQEIKTLENLTNNDEEVNEHEEKHIKQVKKIIEEISKDEENTDLKTIEKETLSDIIELDKLLQSIGSLWEIQLEFTKKENNLLLSDLRNAKVLGDILKEESDILSMEEQLLRKIDLRLGNILRKTTLKLRDVEEAREFNIKYREIKHIR